MIDSPVYPDELEALPARCSSRRASPSRACWPLTPTGTTCWAGWRSPRRRWRAPSRAPRGCRPNPATPSVRCARSTPSTTSTEAPLALAGVQALPVPGRLELGPERELELHPTPGHTADGAAYWMPWTEVLVCGDYLSPVEIPMISEGGSLEAYLATLERLGALVEEAETIVPGHGSPIDARAGAAGARGGCRLPRGAARVGVECQAPARALDAAPARDPRPERRAAQLEAGRLGGRVQRIAASAATATNSSAR